MDVHQEFPKYVYTQSQHISRENHIQMRVRRSARPMQKRFPFRRVLGGVLALSIVVGAAEQQR